MYHCEDITARKMKFSIKDFYSKFDQIYSFLRIWSHLLKKSLMENFIFYEDVSSRLILEDCGGKYYICLPFCWPWPAIYDHDMTCLVTV